MLAGARCPAGEKPRSIAEAEDMVSARVEILQYHYESNTKGVVNFGVHSIILTDR
jgi:hypothetical protein